MRKLLHVKFNTTLISCTVLLSALISGSSYASAMQQDSIRAAANDSSKLGLSVIPAGRLPEVVPTLFGQQVRNRLVQSVSYLDGKKLESAPVGIVSNALPGQLAGLGSIQSTGAPRFDSPNLTIRGRNPLIVVDGVPRYNLINADNNQNLFDVLSINPEQIESVTLLKDALSTAMLGNRGMDGVLMITTRKQGEGKNSSMSFKAQAGLQTPIGMRKALSAFDYATLYNEAAVNSGFAPAYTQAELNAYRTDPVFSGLDWRNEVLKKNAPMQRYTFTAGGNYTNVKYFVSLDYQSQGGLFKEDPNTSYGTNVDYKRYIFRSNLQLNIDKYLTATLNLTGNIQDYIEPGAGYATVFNSLLTTPNNSSRIFLNGDSLAASRQYVNNPYGLAVSTGYLKNNLQAGAVDVNLRRSMDDVVKGMWMKALLSYSPYYEQRVDRSKGYNAYYYPDPTSNGTVTRVRAISDQLNTSSVMGRFQQTYAELSTGYDREWSKNALTAVVLANLDNNQSDNQLNQVYKGISTRLAYSYDQRYNLEAAAAYTSNNWYAPGHQGAFYPSVGASWNLHNENFLKDVAGINEFRLRLSYGQVGNADPGYYLFRERYVASTAYYFGNGNSSSASTSIGAVSVDRRDEKANKLDIGADLAFSKNRGWLNVDYYDNRESNLLQTRGSNSGIFGQAYPGENIGKVRYYGIELNTGWANHVGKLSYSVSGNLSTVGSEILFIDEPSVAYPHMALTGSPANQIRGYVYEGLFNSGNLSAATIPGFTPVVGDARYKDLNNDGIINQNDQTVIGNDRPLLFYGANLGLKYSGFDMNVLVQGVAHRDILTAGNYEFPISNNGFGQAYEYNLNRYNAQNASTATLPRVTLGTDINNYIASSLFVRNGSFLRLKNVELGYSFGGKALASAKIKGIRVFVNGENLLTASEYKESDPEDYTGLYPLQRVINGGLSIKL
ncbi:MAG: hypothetical protein K0S09_699 [Sphingobacteriaceae bacterium]|jgi:TonB-linked SusC/RagA family outer membrane protein|nr:hypothetical protein [Sphingobacteriaceae bacterium]